jgi:hypothetical protein
MGQIHTTNTEKTGESRFDPRIGWSSIDRSVNSKTGSRFRAPGSSRARAVFGVCSGESSTPIFGSTRGAPRTTRRQEGEAIMIRTPMPQGPSSRPGRPSLLLAASALAALAGSASAGTPIQWINPLGGSWDQATNWDGLVIPATTLVTAEISLAGAYTVTLGSGRTIGGLALLNHDAALDLNNGSALTLRSDTEPLAELINNAIVTVNANQGLNATTLTLGDADTQGLLGAEPGQTGEVVLNLPSGNNDLPDAHLVIQGNGLHAANHTVRGKGRVAGVFTNAGLFLADRPGDELRVAADLTQAASGILHATNGGLLGIGEGGVVRGGTLTTDAGGRIRFSSGTGTLADGAHLLGEAEVPNGQTMAIGAGGLTNDGTITVNSNQGLNFTQVRVDATTTIAGSGVIDLNLADGNNDYADASLIAGPGVVATNGPDHAVTGKGRLAGEWVNEGVISANRAGQELRVAASVTQSPDGLLHAVDNAVLGLGEGAVIRGGLANTADGGVIHVTSGTATIRDGLVNSGSMGVRNGQVLAIGENGVVNNGTISVNANQGLNGTLLRVDADALISGTGRIDLNLADGNSDLFDANLNASPSFTGTIGPDQTVSGKGVITGSWVNRGTIDADRPGQDLRVGATMLQTTGVIKGSNGGFAVLEAASVTGGSLDSDTGGAVHAQGFGGSISAVTNLGDAGLRNGSSLNLLSGGLTNNGLITINTNSGVAGTVLAVAENAFIDGAGVIDLNIAPGNSDLFDAQLTTAVGVTAVHEAGHTVSGKGRLSGNWINRGTVTGNREFQDLALAGTFDQETSGVVRADNGGFAVLLGAAVSGGFFDSDGISAVEAQGAGNSVSGVTSLNRAGVRNGAGLTILGGGFTNEGLVTVNTTAGVANAVVSITEPATIDGAGVIDLNIADGNGDLFDAQINTVGVTAIHGPDHTISGKGRITGDWLNHGAFLANRPGQDLQINGTIAQSAAGVIRGENAGAVAFAGASVTGGAFQSDSGGSVQFASGVNTMSGVTSTGQAGIRSGASVNLLAAGFTNNATFTINSNASVANTALTAIESATIDGDGSVHLGLAPGNGDLFDAQLGAAPGAVLTIGPEQRVTGRGRLFGQIAVEGTLAPGSSVATLSMQGGEGDALTLAPSAVYEVEASAEEVNDRVASTVPVHLDGTLVFTPIEEFDPPRPTRYTIVTGPDISGEFHTLVYNGVVPEGGVFRVVYTSTETIAAVTCKADIAPPIGILDLADITFFVSLFQLGSPLVDLAEPFGVLDLADIVAFVTAFGVGCGE